MAKVRRNRSRRRNKRHHSHSVAGGFFAPAPAADVSSMSSSNSLNNVQSQISPQAYYPGYVIGAPPIGGLPTVYPQSAGYRAKMHRGITRAIKASRKATCQS